MGGRVDSGTHHHIQLDDPELVNDAIHQVVDSVRRRAKLEP
jgi:hypothetical protein